VKEKSLQMSELCFWKVLKITKLLGTMGFQLNSMENVEKKGKDHFFLENVATYFSHKC